MYPDWKAELKGGLELVQLYVKNQLDQKQLF